MSRYDVKELKGAGVMKQKEKDLFSLRLQSLWSMCRRMSG